MKFLLILLGIYLGFRIIGRYFLPSIMKWLMGYLGKKAQENMRSQGFDPSQFGGQYEEPVSGDEKVTIKKTQSQKADTKNMDGVGEYVDFEEVE